MSMQSRSVRIPETVYGVVKEVANMKGYTIEQTLSEYLLRGLLLELYDIEVVHSEYHDRLQALLKPLRFRSYRRKSKGSKEAEDVVPA